MVVPKRWLQALILAIAVQVSLVATARAQTVTVETSLLEELQKVIKQQQEQIERQSEVLDSLQRQVNDLQKTTTEAQAEASEAMSTAKEAKDVEGIPEGDIVFVPAGFSPELPDQKPLTVSVSVASILAEAATQKLRAGETSTLESIQLLYLKPFSIGKKAKTAKDLR